MEENLEYVNEFKKNVVRSMSIRIKLTQQRVCAVEALEYNHLDERGIKLLKRCIKNERKFLKIVDVGLEESYYKLKKVNSWIREHVKDKESRNKVKRLIKLIEIFKSKIDDIEERLELEEIFVANGDVDSFRNFVKQWNIELKLNRKLLKKIVDIHEVDDYVKKIGIILQNTTTILKRGTLSAGMGAFIQKFFFFPGFRDKLTGEPLPDNEQIIIAALSLAFVGVCVGIIIILENIEQKIEIINIGELELAKKTI